MEISTVIVSYNTKDFLSDCLKSLQDALKGFKSEIFVVDNNSVDGTREHVEKNFPDVILIKNKENLGFSKANNIALKKAKGKYILILNPDTKLFPNTLSALLDRIRLLPKDVGIITCRLELASGQLDKDCRRQFPTPWRSLAHFSGLSKIFPRTKLFDGYYYGYLDEEQETEIEACAGAFMLIKKEALDKVGIFDEDFFFYGEDLDLCYRFNKAGYKIVYSPVTKIIHLKGVASGIKKHSKNLSSASVDTRKKARQESIRAMKLFYQKHFQKKYPFYINWLVYLGINLLEKFRVAKI